MQTQPSRQKLAVVGHFLRARLRWAMLRGERLARFQQRRARQTVAFAAGHAPFYRQHWQGHDLAYWQLLPAVDKALMMANFASFNSCGVGLDEAMRLALDAERQRDARPTLRGLTVGLSSGTSGQRGLFLLSPQEQAAWAGTILARTLHHLRPCRVAFFLRSNSNLYEQVGGSLVQFRYLDLMTPLGEACALLNGYQPDVVVGPPSLLGLLAEQQRQGALQLRLRQAISVAEVLEPHDAAQIGAAFGVRVDQVYQCTEGLLAASCLQGSLHLQEDLVAVQLDPLAGPCGAEQRYTPVVTDLWRRVQPIVRYRLNDVLLLDEQRCRCGSDWRVIRAIEGRCDDLCYFFGAHGELRPVFPDTLRRILLLAGAGVRDYLVVQEWPGQLRVHLLLEEGVDLALTVQRLRAEALATLASYGCAAPELCFEAGLPPQAGAKRRRVQALHAKR